MHWISKTFVVLLAVCPAAAIKAQHTGGQDSITVVAGPEYGKSSLHQWFFGKNRRKEWTTPVRVPVVMLDTAMGGLQPYKRGGGNESKTLRLRSAAGKEYVLHSVNKSRDAVIPRMLKHSFFASIIRDGVSMSYPYGALAVPVMMTHGGIFHSNPRLVYIPRQPALDSFDAVFGDDLYMLEERPDGDWSEGAPHLGGFKNFYSTNDVVEKIHTDRLFKADQYAFIKGRLFDILVADWDRNHDNWRWGAAENDSTRFIPISRDRDQAFFTRDGWLISLMMPLMRVGFMQHFGYTIRDVGKLTSQDRKVDEVFTNEMSYTDWQKAAQAITSALTDSVIAASVAQLPPAIFAISGEELIAKLKSRRDRLTEYATAFYNVLARDVKVDGTTQKDHFRLTELPDRSVCLEIFRVHPATGKEAIPYYKRIFYPKETRRLTLNGFGGDDEFDIGPHRYFKVAIRNAPASFPLFPSK